MDNFFWESIAYYAIFSFFVFYQQLQSKNFKGNSPAAGFFFGLFGFVGMLLQLFYFGYYGWNISWVAAIGAVVIGLIVAIVLGRIFEKIFGAVLLAFLGFVGVPVCAYLMFKTLPV